MQRSRIYWSAQIIGWTIFFAVNFFLPPGKNVLTANNILYHISLVPSAILLTHIYRLLIIKKHWLKKTILTQLLVAIVSGYVLSLSFLILQYILNSSIFGYYNRLSLIDISISLINFWFVFLVWNIIYY